MSQSPNDQKLVEFIRQNRPSVPAVNEDLEAKIMTAVAATSRSEPVKHTSMSSWRWRRLWLMPPAIAVGLLMTWGTNQLFRPTPPTATELASLEVFIEQTWDDVLEPEQQDWYLGF